MKKLGPTGMSGKKTKICLFISIIITAGLNAGTVSKVGTAAAPFLKIGVGGRALGMGEAYTTLAGDVTGAYWNPAGLALVTRNEILLNHYDYIADMSYNHLAVALPFSRFGTAAVNISYLGMPDIERTTVLNPDGTGEMVAASSMMTSLSYGISLTDRFAIGGSAKYIREMLWHCSASAVAMNVGVLYRTFFKNLMIGMSISNFGTDLQLSGSDLLIQYDVDSESNGNNGNINGNLATDPFTLPMLFRVGLSANIAKDFFGLTNSDWIIAVDAVHPNDNYEYLNVGSEYVFHELLAFRCGYRQLFLKDAEGGLTFGFGLHLKLRGYGLRMDYAAVDFGRLDYLNKFSLILSL